MSSETSTHRSVEATSLQGLEEAQLRATENDGEVWSSAERVALVIKRSAVEELAPLSRGVTIECRISTRESATDKMRWRDGVFSAVGDLEPLMLGLAPGPHRRQSAYWQ